MNKKNNFVKLIISDNDINQTIFSFLKKVFFKNSLSVIYKLFRSNKIKLNGFFINNRKYILKKNDELLIFDNKLKLYNRNLIHFKKKYNIDNKKNKLFIIYEDENILIVNKPHNIEIHSNFYSSDLDTLVRNYLIKKNNFYLKENSFIISHIHRIDKFSKGLVIYAKNKITLNILLDKINNNNFIKKFYLLKIEGIFKLNKLLNGFIYKDNLNKKMIFSLNNNDNNEKKCSAKFKTLKIINNFSWLEAQLLTGRKHQIRAMMSYLGHPIVNDVKYGAKKENNKNMIFLYSYKIIFNNFNNHLSYLNKKIFQIKKNILMK